jgi:hypothetical protein
LKLRTCAFVTSNITTGYNFYIGINSSYSLLSHDTISECIPKIVDYFGVYSEIVRQNGTPSASPENRPSAKTVGVPVGTP